MNTSLLQPALQRIINAVDSLPGRKSKHVPKSVLDAVEEGRKALESLSPSLALTATTPTVTGYYWVQSPDYNEPVVVYFDTDFRGEVSFSGDDQTCRVDDILDALWSERIEAPPVVSLPQRKEIGIPFSRPLSHDFSQFPQYVLGCSYTPDVQATILDDIVVEPPSKQRITLRGGPLDGCWYLRAVTPRDIHRNAFHFEFYVPWECDDVVLYSLPDSHGICYYRE